MLRRHVLMAAALALLLACGCMGKTNPDPQTLYTDAKWFRLREAVTDRSSPLLRGAVATAFNDMDKAEGLLLDIIRAEPPSDAADDAYDLLSRIYLRSGQYARLAESYRAWAAAFPTSERVQRWRQEYDEFQGRPDQLNGPRVPSTLTSDGDGYLMVPVAVDGHTDSFILDTGAWQSAMTEREAMKLGLTIGDDARVLTDASGSRTTFLTVVVDELTIGAMGFENVSFAVINPEGSLANSEFGIIGMPILLAIGTVHWFSDGRVELGGELPDPSDMAVPNLAFDRGRLLLSTEVLGKAVLGTFDTGANTTQLNANFADSFPDLIRESGVRGTQDIAGIGNAQSFESVELPQLEMRIGRKSVMLAPAEITLQRIKLLGGECCIGNLGYDLLDQGREFSIDFARMTLAVR